MISLTLNFVFDNGHAIYSICLSNIIFYGMVCIKEKDIKAVFDITNTSMFNLKLN